MSQWPSAVVPAQDLSSSRPARETACGHDTRSPRAVPPVAARGAGMEDELIYAASSRGLAELQSSATALPPAELALLVRFDGQLTWAEVRATFPPASAPLVAAAANRLLCGGYLRVEEPDAVSLRFRQDLGRLAASGGLAAADAGLAALQRDGFHVRIAREGRARSVPRDAGPPRALVVEDDQMLAQFTRNYLTLDGFDVRVASNGREAMAELAQPPRPDVVLLDLGLPDEDGFQILRRLRQQPLQRDLPVILLTGRATRASVIRGMAAGADGYVTKPFVPDALLQAVRIVLGTDGDVAALRADPWVNRDAQPRRALRQP